MQQDEPRQSSKRMHYKMNRERMRKSRAAKFAWMRSAKERIRIERANADPVLPDTSHVRIPRASAADATIIVRFRDGLSFSTPVYRGPWGGIMPTKAAILRDVAATLSLLS